MEVAQTPSNGGLPPPFHDHDVREWSTLDSLTGVLEKARIETDQWAANTTNGSHKYGKVVDSRARTNADGALRQQARRQLEVFQSQVPGGHLQVIKSHSVSSSHWTNKRIEETTSGEFEGLQIPSNQLDLSFQKSKAVIGRSAARRPPTRIKTKDDALPVSQDNLHSVASVNSQRVTRLCHQIHENAVRQAFGKFTNGSPIKNRLKITEADEKQEGTTNASKRHTNLLRTKSSSSEDFLINFNQEKSTKSIEDLEDLEHLRTWRRTSKLRRSLQYPKQEKRSPNKPIDLPETSVSVKKITEDFEKGRRLSTALRGNNIDLQALDQILQTISNSGSEKTSITDDNPKKSIQTKRNSFVTVESIQEIKGRLKRTSSPEKDLYNKVKDQDTDDGIVTEDLSKPEENMIDSDHSKVKSYVFGMDYTKKPIMGTGSLESRSKLVTGTTSRSEDWYNRRKSYGFEPVQNQNDTISSNRKFVESSTDSGICRSSEVIIIPSAVKNSKTDSDNYLTNNNVFSMKTSADVDKDKNFGNVRRISSLFDNNVFPKTNSFRRDRELNSSWMKKNKENDWSMNSGITIKIPIVSNNHWEDDEKEIKRHSIAVDETKYVSKSTINNEARRTSLMINEKFLNPAVTTEGCDSDSNGFGKKSKKVEFCKTEVHFAAESGKVNIVETDEKPPPTQNFRRRRRNPSYPADFNKNGLPVLHFGENHVEKILFANGSQQYTEEVASEEETEPSIISRTPISHGAVTVNTDLKSLGAFDDESRELNENDNIKGILKNKMVKPKPYHLGDNILDFNFLEEENRNWSSNNFAAKDPPIWKSTVTVSNTLFDNKKSEANSLALNNQPDLRKDHLKRLAEFHYDFRRFEPVGHTKPFVSVADRVRNMGEDQKLENQKGYSTRVNIGEGKAIVIQNTTVNKNDNSTEPVGREPKEMKQILKKGLIVRIGRENSTSQHMVCSKTTSNENSSNKTTTTKITIDLSPTEGEDQQPVSANAKQNGSHSFKSTSLILNTIKSQNEVDVMEKTSCRIPQQLEALKKLYEDENSDSDADREVQLLTSRIAERQTLEEDANSSVVSGSWSRMRAYKNVVEKANQKVSNVVSSSKRSLAQIEKENKIEEQVNPSHNQEGPIRIKAEIKNRKYSPIVLRKHPSVIKTAELRTTHTSEKLSSPLLVERSSLDVVDMKNKSEMFDSTTTKRNDSNIIEENSQRSFIRNERVVRQPEKSELAYFGVPLKSQTDEENNRNKLETNKCKTSVKKENVISCGSDSPIHQIISQNLALKSNSNFDSGILEELTKAADEILQAVKEYSEEETRRQKKEEETKIELTTITENKTWKREAVKKPIERPCKFKLQNESSNSSLETTPKDSKPTHRYVSNTNASADKIKTRTSSSESSGLKATTKARRLQRASSREALLQSHGSSSEDLAASEVPIRKPRLVKKSKTTQLIITNGIEMSKKGTIATNAKRKYEVPKTKVEERIPGALPEIRHKTAVSTIRSTAEKAAREKNKYIHDDVKKKTPQLKEIAKASMSPTNPAKSKRETVTHRLATANIGKYRPDRH